MGVKIANYGYGQDQHGIVGNYIFDYLPTTNTISKTLNLLWIDTSSGQITFINCNKEPLFRAVLFHVYVRS